jgi:hypothetical protein
MFEREMSRKEFLANIGALFLTAIGVAGVVRFFAHGGVQGRKASAGYGTSAYGGRK